MSVMNPAHPASRSETRWGLQLKVILSMLLVGVVPLMVGLGLAFWQGSREIQVVSGESFKALAEETARKVDLLMSDEVGRTSRIAADPSIILELERRRDALLDMTEAERRRAMDRLKEGWEAKDPAAVQAITESKIAGLIQEYLSGAKSEADQLIPQVVRSATKMLYVTDIEGNLVTALTTLPPFANKETAWWKGASHRGVGQLFIEDVHFDERVQSYVISISLPIMDHIRYGVVGVLHRVIDAKELISPSISPIRFGKTGHVMLIDHRGIVMSCPILPTGVRLSDAQLIPTGRAHVVADRRAHLHRAAGQRGVGADRVFDGDASAGGREVTDDRGAGAHLAARDMHVAADRQRGGRWVELAACAGMTATAPQGAECETLARMARRLISRVFDSAASLGEQAAGQAQPASGTARSRGMPIRPPQRSQSP